MNDPYPGTRWCVRRPLISHDVNDYSCDVNAYLTLLFAYVYVSERQCQPGRGERQKNVWNKNKTSSSSFIFVCSSSSLHHNIIYLLRRQKKPWRFKLLLLSWRWPPLSRLTWVVWEDAWRRNLTAAPLLWTMIWMPTSRNWMAQCRRKVYARNPATINWHNVGEKRPSNWPRWDRPRIRLKWLRNSFWPAPMSFVSTFHMVNTRKRKSCWTLSVKSKLSTIIPLPFSVICKAPSSASANLPIPTGKCCKQVKCFALISTHRLAPTNGFSCLIPRLLRLLRLVMIF